MVKYSIDERAEFIYGGRTPGSRGDRRELQRASDTVNETTDSHQAVHGNVSTQNNGVNLVTGACIFLSGSVALTYEICWIRKSTLAFGSTTLAISTCLAVFFAGLAIGSYLFGRRSQQIAKPMRLYAWLEIAVGVCAIVSPAMIRGLNVIYSQIYPLVFHHFALIALTRCLLIMLVILPATVFMGATLPLFCRQFVSAQHRISSSIGFLYGLNTLGAAVGCALCGYVMIPTIGVDTTIYLGGVVNLVIGVVILRSSIAKQEIQIETSSGEPSLTTGNTRGLHASVCMHGLFFTAGFITTSNELLWPRFLGLLIHNSVYTYTLTLTAVLAGIVIGSWLTARFFDGLKQRALVFGALQVTAGLAVLVTMLLPPTWWMSLFRQTQSSTKTLVMLGVILFPAILSGAAFPLAIRMVVEQVSEVSVAVGRMAAVNTVGGIVGSLLTGFFLIPVWGLHLSLLTTSGLGVSIGLVAWLYLAQDDAARSSSMMVRGSLAVVRVIAWFLIWLGMSTRVPHDYFEVSREFVTLREGCGSNIAVVRRNGVLQLEIDQMWQGASNTTHQIMAAHIPTSLHPDPKNVLVIGLGSGQTAGRFLKHNIDTLDCVEIESELIDVVREYFPSSWMDDPRVHFVVDDGRSYVANSARRYDLMSIEVGQVFRSGAASFYSADFYQLAKRRLKPGGIVAQFVPLEYLDVNDFRMIVATFIDTFPNSVLWYNTAELLLIGRIDAEIQLTSKRISELRNRLSDELDFSYWNGSHLTLKRREVYAAGFLMGPRQLTNLVGDQPVYRDDRPILEYSTSGRYSFYAADETDLKQQWQRLRDLTKLIQDHLSPVQSIVGWNLTDEFIAECQFARRLNVVQSLADRTFRMASWMADRNRMTDAMEWLNQTLEFMPEHEQANYQVARNLHRQSKYQAAIAHYQAALRIRATRVPILVSLSFALRSMGMKDEADDMFGRAVEIDPALAEKVSLEFTRLKD